MAINFKIFDPKFDPLNHHNSPMSSQFDLEVDRTKEKRNEAIFIIISVITCKIIFSYVCLWMYYVYTSTYFPIRNEHGEHIYHYFESHVNNEPSFCFNLGISL